MLDLLFNQFCIWRLAEYILVILYVRSRLIGIDINNVFTTDWIFSSEMTTNVYNIIIIIDVVINENNFAPSVFGQRRMHVWSGFPNNRF